MTKQVINVGATANDKKGDSLRAAFQKVNANFNELYTALGLADTTLNLGNFVFEENTVRLTNANNDTSTLTQIEIAQPVRTASDLTVGGDILPNVNLGGSLGSPTQQWKSLYVSTNTIYINNVPLSLDNGNNLTIAGQPISSTIEYANIPNAPKDLADLTDGSNLLTALTGVDSIEFWDSSVQTTAYRYSAQPTAPEMTTGALWFNTTDGRLYINYNNVWVDASPTEIDPSAIRFNQQNQIELPEGGDIVDSLGNSVLNTGSPLITDGVAIAISSDNGNNNINITTDNGNGVIEFPFNGELDFLNQFKIKSTGYNKTWTFQAQGDTDIPGGITSLGDELYLVNNTLTTLYWQNVNPPTTPGQRVNSSVRVNQSGITIRNRDLDSGLAIVDKEWTFGTDGNLTLPEGGDIKDHTGTTVFKANLSQFNNDLEIDANTLTGTTLPSGVTGSSLTSVGTLTGLTSSGVVHITNTENSINADTGSLQVDGGAHITKNLIAEGTIYAGKDAFTEALTNPLMVASSPANVEGGYSQVAILNNTAGASGDYQVFVDGYDVNVSDTGWSDLGYAGSNFSDLRYTITPPGSGYVFVSGLANSTNNGSLVLATDGSGTVNDIIFGTGGFTANKERMRLSNIDNTFYVGNNNQPVNFEVKGAILLNGQITLANGEVIDSQSDQVSIYKNDGITRSEVVLESSAASIGTSKTGDSRYSKVIASHANVIVRTRDIDGVLKSWAFNNNGTLQLPVGGDIVDSSGVSVLSGSTYTLPTASDTVLGGVKVDGTTIVINNGVISSTGGTGGYSLPTASNSTLGGVKIDGSTITINGSGVISAVIPTNISTFTNDAGYLTSVTTITGNAGTATKLATARNINGVAFDGTGDITVTAAAGTLTGNTLNSGVVNSSLTSVGTLTNLTVTNPIAGSVTGSAGSVSGANITGTTLASNVVSSSLTSVGTLANLTVTNPIVGTVQNGVVTTGTYANPAWITSLAYSKLTGAPTLATVATTGSYTDLTNTPAAYSLPTASNTVLGGVKVDASTITINGSGVISAAGVPSLINGSNVLKLVSAPASLLGASGDTAGSIAIDGGYIYYCTRNYTGAAYTYTVTTNATTASMNSYLPPANSVIGTLVYIQGPLPIQPQTTWTLTYNGTTYTIGAVGNPNNGNNTQVYLTNSGINIPANSTVTLNAPASSNIWTRTPWNATDRYGISVTNGTASGGGSLTYNPINGQFTFAPAVTTNPTFSGGVAVSGNISQSAWGINGVGIRTIANTYTDTSSSGTVTTNMAHSIIAPTLAATNATTYTNASTLYISNAPTAGTNVTLTNPYALYVASGNAYFGGQVVKPNLAAFRVYGSGSTTWTTTSPANGQMTSSQFTVDYNQGSNLNATTGVFTAPVAGLYQINLTVRTSSNTNSGINQAAVVKNPSGTNTVQCMVEFGINTTMNHAGSSTVAKLAAGDTLVFKILVGSIQFDANDNWSVAFLG